MAYCVELENKVSSRRFFSFYTNREFEKWKVERAELKILLEQDDSYAHALVGDLEILCDEVFYLWDEVCCTNEVKVQGNFLLGLLESKRCSTKAQLSLA